MQRTTTSHLKPLLRSPNPKPKTPTMSTPKSKPFNSSTSLLPLPPSLPPPPPRKAGTPSSSTSMLAETLPMPSGSSPRRPQFLAAAP
ncbi:hypothetical protein ACFX15_017813 [Malus domestica]|uniref:Uncharacterized protein n=1 Tax=Malus domestica TaxID=3750 RepID=A0A498HW85_MALDO|nr:hypothetical protein DVH24_029781 [Malus domestica]